MMAKPTARTTAKAKTETPVPKPLVAAARTPDVVEVPARKCLAIDGAGSPENPAFSQSIGALYGVAYALKFTRKKAGKPDFKVGPLEGRWAADWPLDAQAPPPPDRWRWRLRIGVPGGVSADEVERIKRDVVAKKGGKLHGSAVVPHIVLESVPAQRLGRILHLGPYADEAASFALIDPVLEKAGLEPAPTHLEVYLSDPGRTKPAALKTVLLRELAA
jgi:hypothetical protein